MRTRRPFFRSRPSPALLGLTAGTALLSLAAVLGPLAPLFGFVTPSPRVLLSITVITLAYLAASELTKRRFFTPPPPPPLL